VLNYIIFLNIFVWYCFIKFLHYAEKKNINEVACKFYYTNLAWGKCSSKKDIERERVQHASCLSCLCVPTSTLRPKTHTLNDMGSMENPCAF